MLCIRGPFLGHSPVMCFLFIPLGLPHRVKGAFLDFHSACTARPLLLLPLGPTRLRKSRRNPAQPRPEGREGVLATRPGGVGPSGNYLGHREQRQLRKPRSDQAETGENKQARVSARGGSKWQASPSRAPEPGRRRCQPRGPGRGARGTASRPPPPPQPTPTSCPASYPQGRGPRRLLPGGWVRRCQRAASFITSARAQGLTARAPPLPPSLGPPDPRTTSARGTGGPPVRATGEGGGTVTAGPGVP